MNDTTAPQKTSYDTTAKLLHWLIAAMIALQFVLAKLADLAENHGEELRTLALLANHKSVGISILLLAIVRLAWRNWSAPPPLPVSMPRWQHRASNVSHFLMYALLFAMPLSGWLMSSASAYTVSWFNLFQLPDFVGPDPQLKDRLEEVHELLAKLLFVIVMVHIGAALKHALWDRDGVLQRMLSIAGLAVFVAVLALGLPWLIPNRLVATAPVGNDGDDAIAVENSRPQTASNLPVWSIDYSKSAIEFTAVQAGGEFTGRWTDWTASLQFTGQQLDEGVFDVTIKTGGVDTGDAERDETLMEPEWFDLENFATIKFVARKFVATDDGGFAAHGELRIKDQPAPVVFEFRLSRSGEQIELRGQSKLDRLQLGVGTGEWTDTEWVGQFVDVDVSILASTAD